MLTMCRAVLGAEDSHITKTKRKDIEHGCHGRRQEITIEIVMG